MQEKKKTYKKDKAKIIRDEILIRLSRGENLRFSDLQVKNVDSNLFTYHLKSLRNENLIYKNGLKYNLTDEGKNYVESLSGKTKGLRVQPKIHSLIIIENKDKEYLLLKRNKHPFLGCYSFPYGKMHVGESVHDAAMRELQEKAGMTTKLKCIGTIYLRILKNKKTINHFLFNVSIGKENGVHGFEKIEKVRENLLPGMYEVLQATMQKGFCFADLTVELK